MADEATPNMPTGLIPDPAFLAATQEAERRALGTEEPAPEPPADHPDVALLKSIDIDPVAATAAIEANPALAARLDEMPLETESDVLKRAMVVERAARQAEEDRLARLGQLATMSQAVEAAAESVDLGFPVADVLAELEQTSGPEAAQALAERVAAEEAAYEAEPVTAADWLQQKAALQSLRQAAAVAAAQRQQTEQAQANLAAVERTIAEFKEANPGSEELMPVMSEILSDQSFATSLLFGDENQRRQVLEDAHAGAAEYVRAQHVAKAQAEALLEGERWSAQANATGIPQPHTIDKAAGQAWVNAKAAELLPSKIDHSRISSRGLQDRAIAAMQSRAQEIESWAAETTAAKKAGTSMADLRKQGGSLEQFEGQSFTELSREAEAKARGRR